MMLFFFFFKYINLFINKPKLVNLENCSCSCLYYLLSSPLSLIIWKNKIVVSPWSAWVLAYSLVALSEEKQSFQKMIYQRVAVLSVCISVILANPAAQSNGPAIDDEGTKVKNFSLLLNVEVHSLTGGLTPTGCCDWPSCYDERTQLCLDTCLMTWSQCPHKLTLISCYSEFMSPFGALPVQCYPDAGPHLDEAETLGLSGSPREVKIIKLNFTSSY